MLDLPVVLGQLHADEVEHGQCLLEREQMFGSPMALQGLGDLIDAGTDAHVLHRGQHPAIALARDDGAQDLLSGLARDVVNDVGELGVHLRERLLHGLHMPTLAPQQHPAQTPQRLIDQLRPGDVLVVWKLDRLSHSLKDLLNLLEKVQLVGAGFHSLTEAIDTTTPAGCMMMQIVGSFAEFERAMLRERTRNGLLAARNEGRIGGRRPKLTPHQQQEIFQMVAADKKTAADAVRLFNVHPSTVARLMARSNLARNLNVL